MIQIWIFMIQNGIHQNQNYDDSLLRYYVVITLQNWIKSLNFTQLSQCTRKKNNMKIVSKIHLNLFNTMANFFEKCSVII